MEIDPTGEEECCVNNHDIHFVSIDPAYWDGKLQVLNRDPNNKYYNIIGAKYVTSGYKVCINTLSIENAICNDPDLPIDYSECGSEETAQNYKENDDKTRQKIKDISKQIELKLFCEWATNKANEMTGSKEDLVFAATEFFNENLSPNDPIPKEIIETTTKTRDDGWVEHASYNTRRKLYWDLVIKIEYDGLDWNFSKK